MFFFVFNAHGGLHFRMFVITFLPSVVLCLFILFLESVLYHLAQVIRASISSRARTTYLILYLVFVSSHNTFLWYLSHCVQLTLFFAVEHCSIFHLFDLYFLGFYFTIVPAKFELDQSIPIRFYLITCQG
jgi:hypothetical protein